MAAASRLSRGSITRWGIELHRHHGAGRGPDLLTDPSRFAARLYLDWAPACAGVTDKGWRKGYANSNHFAPLRPLRSLRETLHRFDLARGPLARPALE